MKAEFKKSLYIALYDIGLGRFHCALVVTPENAPLNSVAIYQIIDSDSTSPNKPGDWTTDHKISEDLLHPDAGTSAFVGCVKLPECDNPPQQVMDWMTEQEPEQGESALEMGSKEWNCAEWVLRVLLRLGESGLYSLDLHHIFARVLIHAHTLKRLREEDSTVTHVVNL